MVEWLLLHLVYGHHTHTLVINDLRALTTGELAKFLGPLAASTISGVINMIVGLQEDVGPKVEKVQAFSPFSGLARRV